MPASERTMHELLKLLSKAVSAINLFSGGILAEIIVAHHINAYVLNRRVITCSISSRKTDFKLNPYREKIFLVFASILLEQFQHRFGFETVHEKTCSFPSHIGNSVPTFRDIKLHLGQSIQEWTESNLWTIFKKIEVIWSA